MTIQYRESVDGEVREVNESKRQVEAKVCSYGVGPDTYNTTWQRGAFQDGFEKHGLPVICWGHDQRDIIGSAIGYRDEEDGLYLTMQFADPDDVPSARRAYSLIKDGHVKGWSFGFSDGKTEPDPQYKGAFRFRSARMFEASPVTRASIPMTRTVAVRAAGGETREVRDEDALIYALRSAITDTDGIRSVTLNFGDEPADPEPDEGIRADMIAGVLALDSALYDAVELVRSADMDAWPVEARELAALSLAAVDLSGDLAAQCGVRGAELAVRAVSKGDKVTVGGQDATVVSVMNNGAVLVDMGGKTKMVKASEIEDAEPDMDGDEPASRAAVSDRPWSDFTQADYTDQQWRDACLITGPTKSDCKLPVREPDGTLNRNAVHAAASRLSQVQGDKAGAASKLRGLYKQLGETPPDSLREAEDAEFRAALDLLDRQTLGY